MSTRRRACFHKLIVIVTVIQIESHFYIKRDTTDFILKHLIR